MMQALLGEDRERPIVVFGYSINHWQAQNAVLRLVTLGYPKVYWYRGGWEAWDAHDLPAHQRGGEAKQLEGKPHEPKPIAGELAHEEPAVGAIFAPLWSEDSQQREPVPGASDEKRSVQASRGRKYGSAKR